MIPIFLYAAWLLFLMLCAGAAAKRALQTLLADRTGTDRPQSWSDVPETMLLGLISIVTIASLVSLLHPVDLAVHLCIAGLAIALGLPLLLRRLRNGALPPFRLWHWPLLGLAAIWLGFMTYVASDASKHTDTGLYHAQMVKWNHEFGAVPGLANLQWRYGFNSSFDLFAAFADQQYFTGKSFHVCNLTISCIFLLVAWVGLYRWGAGDRSLGTILRCLSVTILLYSYASLLPSLSTDWPAQLLLASLLIFVVEYVDQPGAGSRWKIPFIAAMCVFTITVKLSTAPIVLLFIVTIILARADLPTVTLSFAIAALVGIPFVLRTIVLTGYPFYPFPSLDLFNFDWKVPRTEVRAQELLIKNWAINPTGEWYRTGEMNFGQKIQSWLKGRGREAVPLLPWLAAAVISWGGLLAGKRKQHDDGVSKWLTITGVLLIGLFFCAVKGAEPRYMASWCLALGVFSSAWFIYRFQPAAGSRSRAWSIAGNIFMLLCLLCLVRFSGLSRLREEKLRVLWRVRDFPVAKMHAMRSKNGAIVNMPGPDALSWNSALPSTAECNPWLQMRGPELRDGFRVTQIGVSGGTRLWQQGWEHL